MPAALGELEARLGANIIDFASSMDRAAYITQQAFGKIQNQFDSLERKVIGFAAGIAGALSVKALVDYSASVIKATAALDDLAERTGATVENLSAIQPIAKQAGVQMETIATAAEKLSKGLINADDETKGAGAALKALGLSATDAAGKLKDPITLMQESALAFQRYEDGATKSAVVQALFGRGAGQLLPLLNDLAQAGELNARVTTEQAAEAEKLEKAIVRLKITGEDNARAILLQSLPAMQALVDAITQVINQGNKLAGDSSIASWAEKIVGAIGFVVDAAQGIARVFEIVGKKIGETLAQTSTLGDTLEGVFLISTGHVSQGLQLIQSAIARSSEISKEFAADLDAIMQRPFFSEGINKLLEYQRISREITAQYGNRLYDPSDLYGREGRGVGRDRGQLYFNPGTEKKPRVDKAQELYNELITEAVILTAQLAQGTEKLTKSEEKRIKVLGDTAFLKAPETMKKLILGILDYNISLEKENEIQKSLNKAREESDKRLQKLDELYEQTIKEIDRSVEQLEFEAEAIKLSNAERETAIRLREIENKGIEKGSEAYEEYARRIRAAIESKETTQGQIDLWKRVEGFANEAFLNIGKDWKSLGERMRDAFKTTVLQVLYEMTVKRWIINIGANVFGGGGTNALSSILGGGQGGGIIGTLSNLFGGGGSGLGNLLGGGGITGGLSSAFLSLGGSLGGSVGGFLSGIGGGLSGGLSGIGANLGSAGSLLAGGQTAAGLGTALGAIGTAVPYIAAAYAIYQALAKPRGGAKEGGSFAASISQNSFTALPERRLFTPSNADDLARTLGEGIVAEYQNLIRALGGTVASDLRVGLGFDTDPKGTAQNRISSFVESGGQRLFGSTDRAVGRDPAQLQEQLNVESRRILLTALQSSELPELVRGFVRRQTAAQLDVKQIDQVVTIAQRLAKINIGTLPESIKRLFETLDIAANNSDRVFALAEGFLAVSDIVSRDISKDVADAQLSSIESFTRQGEALRDLANRFDGSVEASQALTQATQAYYNAQVQLLVQLDQLKNKLIGPEGIFSATIRNLQFGLLDDKGKYEFLDKEALALFDKLRSAVDPNQIDRYAERLNAIFSEAFGLLDPEERKQRIQEYIDKIREVERLTEERLAAIRGGVADRGSETPIGAVNTAFIEAIDKFNQSSTSSAERNERAAESLEHGADVIDRAIDRFGNLIDRGTRLLIEITDNRITAREV